MSRLRKQGAAEYLGVSVSTLNGLMRDRKIDYYKGDSEKSMVFFDTTDLDQYIEDTKVSRIKRREQVAAYQTFRKRRVIA